MPEIKDVLATAGGGSQFGGAFSSDKIFLSFAGLNDGATGVNVTGSSNLIVQSMDMQYSQTITRLFALENNKIYYVRGQTNAQSQLVGVLGPAHGIGTFIRDRSDVCKATDVSLSSVGDCLKKGKVTQSSGSDTGTSGTDSGKRIITMSHFVISGVNFKMQVSDYLLFNGMTGTFVSLGIKEDG